MIPSIDLDVQSDDDDETHLSLSFSPARTPHQSSGNVKPIRLDQENFMGTQISCSEILSSSGTINNGMSPADQLRTTIRQIYNGTLRTCSMASAMKDLKENGCPISKECVKQIGQCLTALQRMEEGNLADKEREAERRRVGAVSRRVEDELKEERLEKWLKELQETVPKIIKNTVIESTKEMERNQGELLEQFSRLMTERSDDQLKHAIDGVMRMVEALDCRMSMLEKKFSNLESAIESLRSSSVKKLLGPNTIDSGVQNFNPQRENRRLEESFQRREDYWRARTEAMEARMESLVEVLGQRKTIGRTTNDDGDKCGEHSVVSRNIHESPSNVDETSGVHGNSSDLDTLTPPLFDTFKERGSTLLEGSDKIDETNSAIGDIAGSRDASMRKQKGNDLNKPKSVFDSIEQKMLDDAVVPTSALDPDTVPLAVGEVVLDDYLVVEVLSSQKDLTFVNLTPGSEISSAAESTQRVDTSRLISSIDVDIRQIKRKRGDPNRITLRSRRIDSHQIACSSQTLGTPLSLRQMGRTRKVLHNLETLRRKVIISSNDAELEGTRQVLRDDNGINLPMIGMGMTIKPSDENGSRSNQMDQHAVLSSDGIRNQFTGCHSEEPCSYVMDEVSSKAAKSSKRRRVGKTSSKQRKTPKMAYPTPKASNVAISLLAGQPRVPSTPVPRVAESDALRAELEAGSLWMPSCSTRKTALKAMDKMKTQMPILNAKTRR
ncbi:hypothetical protein BJ742DRAFT_417279 [Cladochytrium replicatum]|nr:hypothetical protein BJ742DRAFT_417279 [Cladochytrium replicatum]